MTYGDPSGTYRGDQQYPGGAVPAAGLGKRVLARLLDLILINIVFGIIGFAIGAGVSSTSTSLNLTAWGLGLVQAVATLAYFAYLESTRGQTLGKMALSLRTESAGGGLPTLKQAAVRNSWVLLGIIPFGAFLLIVAYIVIMVTIGTSETNQGLHDKYAGTKVVNG